ncbi:hypothetical protein DY052_07630 [Apilactobacillus timberlakei]|uniref:hypothetical protein n=1 Tax=Apilactobacillus timberlakei TaxID=2008380 RepID=UPI00112A274A|nr:hypothetical protein [Apilactobacillus timberlakei]TPR13724.1 hypothetical protein DY052_07630 [Apilactobacillus timberlakei]
MNLLMKIFIALKMKIAPHLLMSVPVKATATDEFNNYGMSTLAHAAHSSDAYNAANYYISFEHYLNTTQPIAYWITSFWGWFSEMLYYTAKALIEVFVKLFNIFTLTSSNPQINGILTDIKIFGSFVLLLSVLIVLCSYVFHPTNGLTKIKTVGLNIVIISLVSCAVPYFAPKFINGTQYAAHVLFQTQTPTTVQIPDHIVQTNVLDLPDVSVDSFLKNKGQLPDYVNHSKKNKIFVSTTDYSNNIPIKPFMINESQMSQSQLDYWSGFNGTDAGTFLANVGSNDNNLNNDTMTSWKDQITKKIQVLKMKAQAQQLKKDKKKIDKSTNIFSKGINAIGYAGDVERSALSDIGSYLVNNDYLSAFGIKGDPAKFLSVFTYNINGSGDSSTLQKFPQFNSSFGGAIFNVIAHPVKSILGPAFQESYVRYSVNWWNIWLGLIFVIFAMSVYIFKLVKTWFKYIVMYVSSYLIIAKHVGNADKVKEFIYNFFGIFEILLADVITLYLLFTCYSMLNSEISIIIYSFKSAAFANPLTSALITFIADWALFQAGIGGIGAINDQIGGKENQAGHQQSLLQTLTALKMTSMATKGVTNAGSKALSPVSSLAGKGVKAGWNGMHKGGKDAAHPLGKTADGSLGDMAKSKKPTDKPFDYKKDEDKENQDKNGNKKNDGFNGNKKGTGTPDNPENVKSSQDAMKDAKSNSDNNQSNDGDAGQNNNDDQNSDDDAGQNNNDDQNSDDDAGQNNNDDQNSDDDAGQNNNDDQNSDGDASQSNDYQSNDDNQSNGGNNHNESSGGNQSNGGNNHNESSGVSQSNGGNNHNESSGVSQSNGGNNHNESSGVSQSNSGNSHSESSGNSGNSHSESSGVSQSNGGNNHSENSNNQFKDHIDFGDNNNKK